LAEDGSGDVIVRLYEAHGTRAKGSLTAGFNFVSVQETDLLERRVDNVAIRGTELPMVELELRPFQLVTLRFALES
jgi:alpha-mannosidase